MSRALTVVKLGGSHATSPLLGGWLAAISCRSGGVVVVPGGGPFADAVRLAQPAIGFDDSAAHDMALMAMTQYGRALVGIAKCFVLATDLPSVWAALQQSAIPVWSPWPMLQGHPDIPRTWDVTSDSLSVWLATVLAADRLVLIKHRPAPDDRRPEALRRDGLVDAAFPSFAARFAGEILVAGPDNLAYAGAVFGDLPARTA